MATTLNTVRFLLPEIIVIALATWTILGATFTRNRGGWHAFALATLASSAWALWRQSFAIEHSQFDEYLAGHALVVGTLMGDIFGLAMRFAALAMAAIVVLSAWRTSSDSLTGERLGLLLLLTAGVMLVGSSQELTTLFLGLELISIPTYALLFLGRRDRGTAEAAAKYFYLSILSSALFLYGLSFLYGLTGSTWLPAIHASLAVKGASPLCTVALLLIVAGLGFKITAVPFHFYAPDVYQGVSNSTAGLLAVAPKVAGFAALVRLATLAMHTGDPFRWQLLLVLAAVTMTVGNVCALWQNNVRRLMAYSSIAHTGYMLTGLAVAAAVGANTGRGLGGIGATLFYLAMYAAGSLGVFAVLAYLSGGDRELNGVDELAGLGKSRPLAAGLLAVCLFSLAGIPPLAGFWGKFLLFSSALGVGVSHPSAWFFVALAVVGMLNAAIAAAYYLRLVATMYFQPSPAAAVPLRTAGPAPLVAAVVCVVAVVALGALPGPAMRASSLAELSAIRGLSVQLAGKGSSAATNAVAASNSATPASTPE